MTNKKIENDGYDLLKIEENGEVSLHYMHFHSPGIAKIKLDDDRYKYVLDAIDNKTDTNITHKLTVHNSKSFFLKDPNAFYSTILSEYCDTYNKKFGNIVYNPMILDPNTDLYPSIANYWVTYQKKDGFLPITNYIGLYTFIIFVKIPFSNEEQIKLQKTDMNLNYIRNGYMQFIYMNSIGRLNVFNLRLNSDLEKTLILFPANMLHSIYPFKKNDDSEFIYVYGNIALNTMSFGQEA